MSAIAPQTYNRHEATVSAMLAAYPYLQSDNSRRAYKRDVLEFLAWLDNEGEKINASTVEAYAAALEKRGLAISTVNRKLSAVRWYAKRLGQLAKEDAAIIPEGQDREELLGYLEAASKVRDVRDKTPQEDKLKGRHVTLEELHRLLAACKRDGSPAGRRDAALIALAWQTGMRREELASLRMEDLYREEEGFTVAITGKGGKRRELFIYNGAAKLMEAWLATRPALPGYVFLRIYRGGHIAIGGRLSGQAIQDLLDKRRREAEEDGAGPILPLTIHDLRRTLAGDMLDMGVDIATLSKIMGHADVKTTARYDRRPRRVKQEALRRRKIGF